MVLDSNCSQECLVNAGVPQGSIPGPTLFLLYVNDLPDIVISNIAIYADNITLYSKYKKILKTLWPLFMDGVQLPQG